MRRLLVVVLAAFGMISCSPAPVVRVDDPEPPTSPSPTSPSSASPATASSSRPPPQPTPHPAQEAQAQAIKLYPDLAKPGSAFNKTFLHIYTQELKTNPIALQRADWPFDVAKKAALILNVEMGSASPAMPTTAAIQSAPAAPVAMPPMLEGGTVAQGPAATPPVSNLLPKVTSSISFDVRSVATGGGQTTGAAAPTMRSSTSGTSRVRERQTVLELRARNLSKQPATVSFEWVFLAKHVNGRGGAYVWDQGQKQVTLEGGGNTKETLESSELVQVSTVTSQRYLVRYTDGSSRYQTTSTQSKTGSRPVGWVVRMLEDGKVVRVQASSSEYEKFGFRRAQ